ncbi:MAG: AMP-binding protein [Deltaproteobacteria bacterium]|nr:AMP-binding protein [Deltaproteobacteria bacterium]
MSSDTIPSRLFRQQRIRPTEPAYLEKRGGEWRTTTWHEYAELVKRAGKALIALGLEPDPARGNEGVPTVCILGFNRPEWVIMDLAAMCIGGAPAGIYTTCSPSEVQYIVHHAESAVVLVENEVQWKKIDEKRGELPHLRHVVMMRDAKRVDDRAAPAWAGDPLVMSWEEFLAHGDRVEDQRFFQRVDALEPGGLATLIYTSGTTGPPKGVMLSHRNLAWTAAVAQEITDISAADVTLSYLPLSHIAEQMFTVHGPVTTGMKVWFAESIEKVPDNLKEARPTVFFGVPRIWEKFYAALSAKLGEATGSKKKIADWALSVGAKVAQHKARGTELPVALAAQYALAKKLVFSKVKQAIGFDRGRFFVSGAAPIAREVIEFFATLDIMINEVYGQSEGTGPTSFNRPGRTKFGSVGPAIPGVDVRIAKDDEIVFRGPNVFLGYYKEPAATAETLVDGWLHSGDLGVFDDEGFLSITGRKKDIIITAGGKNVTPKNIEGALKQHPLVGEAVVIGDRRKYLTCLVTLDPEATAKWAQERGLDGARAHELPEVRAEIQRQIDRVNQDLARVEQVKKFAVLDKVFGIDTGELTPTLKLKRNVVQKKFADQIDALYSGDEG